jgi:hypothetical protein
MPVCAGCGASYEDSFKFCPYCGRAEPEPIKVIVEHIQTDSDCLTRKDVITLLSSGGSYSTRLVKKNWLGDEQYEPVFRANLSGANLSGIDLSGLDFSGVKLKGANFEGANLSQANLKDALVSCANLVGANLRNANLTHTNFIESILRGADLFGAYLEDACFKKADLTGVNLEGAYYSDREPNWGGAIIGREQIRKIKRVKKSWP